MKLDDRVAVITGGAIGIGAAIGRLFAGEGARVALIDRDVERGEETCRSIRGQGKDCAFYGADVSKADQVARAARQILAHFTRIDILVNNAGIWRPGRVIDLDEETWDSVLDTNLKSIFLVSRQFLPVMIEQKRGVVINVASGAGLVGVTDASAYGASKGGVVNLSRSMALDFAPDNIRVNSICPAWVLTEMNREQLREMKAEPDKAFPPGFRYADVLKLHPLGFLGEPEDIAWAAVYLASDEAKWVTGASFLVDGGFTCQ